MGMTEASVQGGGQGCGHRGRASRGQVGGHVKGNQRSEQRRERGRGENKTERREGRNKLSTWFMDKLKPGRTEGRGHKNLDV